MRGINVRVLTVGFLLVLLLGSCIDDGEDVPPTYSLWGFLEIKNDEYFINTDDNKRLKIKDSENYDLKIENGDRVYTEFGIDETISQMEDYDLLIDLGSITYVGYSNIQTVNEESRDTLGNEELEITYMSISGNYLNMELLYNKTAGDHTLSLCYDEENQVEGELVNLEIRNYSDNTEASDVSAYRLHTYNLVELLNLIDYIDGEIEFDLVINKGTVNKKTYRVKYTPALN